MIDSSMQRACRASNVLCAYGMLLLLAGLSLARMNVLPWFQEFLVLAAGGCGVTGLVLIVATVVMKAISGNCAGE